MKALSFSICVLLVVIATVGACYGQSRSNAAMVQAGSYDPQAVPIITLLDMASGVKAPPIASPTVMPNAVQTGAGPSMSAASTMTQPSTGVAVDANSVYVLQDGKLYKFAKNSIDCCGTAVPPPCPPGSQPCPPCPPSGAGPATPAVCPGNCSGISFIPGFPTSTCSVTTCTPCPPPCPTQPTGCGPAPCPPSPSTIVKCTPDCPTYCNPCPKKCDSCDPCGKPCPQPTVVCATTTTSCAAGPGAGPCACPAVAGVSCNTQNMITCMQALCGVDMDKAYLQAMIQLNQQILALSNGVADYLGTTRLQDYATNSIDDSMGAVEQAQEWLSSKFCLTVTSCAQPLSCIDICNLGAAFDTSYKDNIVQFYIDEIALSQVEMQRGLDCEVKAYAATVIKNDQVRISRLKRCNTCMW